MGPTNTGVLVLGALQAMRTRRVISAALQKVGMPHEILNIVATVDGWNPAKQLRLVVFPIIYRVLHIPGGAGFLPSTVCDFMKMISKHLKTVNVWIKCVIASLRSHLWNSQIFTTKKLRIIHKYWCMCIYISMYPIISALTVPKHPKSFSKSPYVLPKQHLHSRLLCRLPERHNFEGFTSWKTKHRRWKREKIDISWLLKYWV